MTHKFNRVYGNGGMYYRVTDDAGVFRGYVAIDGINSFARWVSFVVSTEDDRHAVLHGKSIKRIGAAYHTRQDAAKRLAA